MKIVGKKVLVVADEEVIRKFLTSYLTSGGYEIKEAADGGQALEQLTKEECDFIILDILTSNKDQWQVLEEMKSNPRSKDKPVIILTDASEDSDMFKGYELGASYYITKPFIKAQLLHGIKLMLEENRESPPVGRHK